MYKVLLVDDEPLVLAGIKIMIDWENNGCELVGNARNGEKALECIRDLQPDIVIADINMPVMDGIELLRNASQQYPSIVFIMLTNLQQFELARDSLRYNAAEYLVKSALEQDTLEKALDRAKGECDKRRSLLGGSAGGGEPRTGGTAALREAITQFITYPALPESAAANLKSAGILEGFMLAEVQFLHPDKAAEKDSGDKLHLWQYELIEELANNCFARHLCTNLDLPENSVFLLLWGRPQEELRQNLEAFWAKLSDASKDLTGVQPCLLACDALQGREGLAQCRRQLFQLRDSFYMSGAYKILYGDIPQYEYRPLSIGGIADMLRAELFCRNANGASALMEKAITAVRDIPHEKAQALWLCSELLETVDTTLKDLPGTQYVEEFQTSSFARYRNLATRDDALKFLEELKNGLEATLCPVGNKTSDIVQRAIQYVYDNIDKKIMLQDAARCACISPGYLSALFKKQYGENFVDFINRTKINRACELIAKNEYRISQIGYMLSYENAYYFTRVFKRYTGITPSEYSEKLKREAKNA